MTTEATKDTTQEPVRWASHHVISDVGSLRKNNEDSFLVRTERNLYAIADGMGGEEAGQQASALVVEALSHAFPATDTKQSHNTLEYKRRLIQSAAERANRAILDMVKERGLRRSGSTLVALALNPNRPHEALLGHIGDSRAYLLRRGGIHPITQDHTCLAEMGLWDDSDVPSEHKRLTRAVGVDDLLSVEFTVQALEPGDCMLLCSDGLTSMLTQQQILDTVYRHREETLEQQCQALIDAAKEAGGFDNVTVVMVQVAREPQGQTRRVLFSIAGEKHIYDVLEEVAPDVFGPVFQGQVRGLEGDAGAVMIKEFLYPPNNSNYDTAHKLFRREEVVLNLPDMRSNPNVVGCREFILQNTEAGSREFLVLNACHGKSLEKRMHHASFGLPLPEVVRLFNCYLRALVCAHGAGVVHRDICTRNLLAPHPDEGRPVVLGWSMVQGPDSEGNSRIVESREYIAPDFYRSNDEFQGDERSDLYSLTLCLFEALTGRKPFANKFGQDHALHNREYELPDFQHPVFEDAPDLVEVIGRGLAAPERRFESAEHFRAELMGVMAGPQSEPQPKPEPAPLPPTREHEDPTVIMLKQPLHAVDGDTREDLDPIPELPASSPGAPLQHAASSAPSKGYIWLLAIGSFLLGILALLALMLGFGLDLSQLKQKFSPSDEPTEETAPPATVEPAAEP